MARTVLPIVGAVVGTFFGNPQLGYAIGSVIGNAVDPQRIKGPRIGDATLQTSQEGAPRPIVYGTAAVMGNLIDRGPLNKVITEERQGKGGGPVVENESLFMTFAIRICEGEICGVKRIWEDERLVYDIRPGSEILSDSLRYAEGFTLYGGSETQLPDPDLETIHGVGNTPAHRGTAYIVFKEKNLTDRRGSIPQFRFEVQGGLFGPPAPPDENVVEAPDVDFDLLDIIGGALTNSPAGPFPQLESQRTPQPGVKTFVFSLNSATNEADGLNSVYEIYLDGALVFSSDFILVGSQYPRVYVLVNVEGATDCYAQRVGGNYAAITVYSSTSTIPTIIGV